MDATGVSCGSVAAAALGLGCTTRRLTLIDVVQHGNRVALQGAADPRRFAGKTVRIVSRWNGRTAARLKVAKSGLFTATLPLPPSAVRHTQPRALPGAASASERSLALKLDAAHDRHRGALGRDAQGDARRAASRARSARRCRRSASPAGSRAATCASSRASSPTPDGRFRVTLKAPRTDRVYTFRFRTKVRYAPRSRRLYPDVHASAIRGRQLALYRAALMQRRTKIVATIGPASRDPEVLARMVEAGMDVARLNFSHGSADEHAETARRVRDAAGRAGRQVAILQDLPGPEAAHRQAARGRRRVQARRRDDVRLRARRRRGRRVAAVHHLRRAGLDRRARRDHVPRRRRRAPAHQRGARRTRARSTRWSRSAARSPRARA